eukprot:Colp12_sorted_trinity150504_noHs@20061
MARPTAALCCFFALICVATAARDWKMYPPILQIQTTSDIYQVADMHGDVKAITKVLQNAEIIDDQSNWIANTSILVTVGDYIDKGDNSLGVLDLLMKLEVQAAAAGGRLVSVLGNHEFEFLGNPKLDKVQEFADELKRAGLKPADVASGKSKYGEFLRRLPYAAVVNKWFFSHTGNTNRMSIEEITNNYIKYYDMDELTHDFFIGDNSIFEAKNWWYSDDTLTGDQFMTRAVSALGVCHVVLGHDPTDIAFPDDPAGTRERGTVGVRFGGKLWVTDCGMSRAVGYSNGAAIRIRTQFNGSTQASTVSVYYPKKTPKLLFSGSC